ncbi:MAG TPA: choline dehydrogenase [Candidatus Acidoferrum sp.]|nr:choline dehydrogenase [Candidatus Acidoferrum sp.]
MPENSTSFDHIIVGAGSAGCVLASRLTEDPSCRVLLLEAGAPDRSLKIRIPAAFSKLFKSGFDWDYSTEPEPHLFGRRLYWPRGKVLGGSSSINAMIYIRGNRRDYDHWRDLGNEGWGFDDVLPYFLKSEDNENGASEFHGIGGPLCVSNPRYTNVLTRAFLDAARELGIPANPDFNAAPQEGAGVFQLTQKNGARHSAADAFLRPAMRRPNLTVTINSLVSQILIEKSRARGVRYIQSGVVREARTEREVILAGGTVNSPQLLLLSGIGPADELRKLGVQPVLNLPGVGKNLQDHPMVSTGYLCTRPVTLMSAESLPNLLRYFIFKNGPLASNVAEAAIFLRTRESSAVPDLQLLFGPAYYASHGLRKRTDHCFGFAPTLIAPESRGEITLRSANPNDSPAIRANYLSTEPDLRAMIEGVKLSRELAHTKPFAQYRGRELHPGEQARTDAEIAEFVCREAETLYHPVGTCKMGGDELAVVDSKLRVRGIDALRVADASVMPRIIAGNTNAPTIMIAEKAADIIRRGC